LTNISTRAILDSHDAKRLEALRATLDATQASVQKTRQDVIEALGDYMCGTGAGPTPQDVRELKEARLRDAAARRDIECFVACFARDLLAHIHKHTPALPESPPK